MQVPPPKRTVSIRAPPARAGRQGGDRVGTRIGQVSIRAPPARAGRLASNTGTALTVMFQSAPRPRGRGDVGQEASEEGEISFNPRPARAGGAPHRAVRLNRGGGVSIRAPPARAGRPSRPPPRRACRKFQSAPRPRGRGDFRSATPETLSCMFQSAPRPRGRGDQTQYIGRHPVGCFNPRPARAGGATRESRRASRENGFQSAPRPRGRGDTLMTGWPGSFGSFNPRPARAGGATRAHAGDGRQRVVSIRAPPARAGRPVSPPKLASAFMFQSAPRPRGRGDAEVTPSTL